MKSEKGFTLIELLVVIAIIGILAAIAIPQFSEYRKRGFDSRAKSDLRNVATAEEAYYADNEVYLAVTQATANTLPGIGSVSDGVTLSTTLVGTTGFTGLASHTQGTQTFSWDSAAGGLQ